MVTQRGSLCQKSSCRTNPEPTRIGIIGAGGIARKPNLQAIPCVELVAACNARPETARQVAGEFRIPEVVARSSMISRDDLDAIWIGTPPMTHVPSMGAWEGLATTLSRTIRAH
ncbi:hypothetical protein GCM10027360_37650 [Amycolatopsis echigonensis]